MRKALAVGPKELRQIARDRRTLHDSAVHSGVLPASLRLRAQLRHPPRALAVEDRDRIAGEPARSIPRSSTPDTSIWSRSVDTEREVVDLMDRNARPRGARDSVGARARCAQTGASAQVQVLLNGDNANTATTVMGYAVTIIRSESQRYLRRPASQPARAARRVEPRVWYNPELRSTLFLVPGLIAYIAMITAVVSTALSIVREKESGTMEQVRMAPIGTSPFVVGKTLPYFVDLAASALGIIFAARWCCSICRCVGLAAAAAVAVAVPDRRARHGPADLDIADTPAGRVPGGAARRRFCRR